jgi:hypothetical protein
MLTLQITPLRQPIRIEPYDCQGLKKIRLFFIFSLYCLTSVAAFAADYASVLMYHRFGEDKYPSTNIRIEQFEAHLDFISKGNYTVLPLSKIVDHLQQGLDLPDKTVAITIDDAYQSVFTEARPRLKARNFPYTVFVATQPVDRNQPGYMSWDQIRFFELPRFAMNEQYGSIDRLQLAIDGLPLKVDQIVPEDVVLNNNNNPPNYGFTLAPDIANDRQLRCFNSTYGKLKVYILGPRAEIRLPGALARGRARINCTMPGGDGRWRWFGRQFLVP